MAQLLETLRNAVQTSIFGRRLGLDVNDALLGVKGLREPIEDLSSTAATSATNYGVTRVVLSSSQTGSFTLQAPIPGLVKTLTLACTSTGGAQFTATNGTIYTASAGTSSAVVNLFAPGAAVQLLAETTAVWRVIGGSLGTTTTPLVTFTTST